MPIAPDFRKRLHRKETSTNSVQLFSINEPCTVYYMIDRGANNLHKENSHVRLKRTIQLFNAL